jgi:hypothetical protein
MSRGLQWLNVIACSVLGAVIACWIAVDVWPHVHFVSAVQAQGNIKTVIVDPPHRNDPIEVVKVLIAGKAAVAGEPSTDDLRWWPDGGYMPRHEARVAYRLPADDTWLGTLSFVLRNRTAQKIASLDIMVLLPQERMKTASEFSFGQLPTAVAYSADGKPIVQTREPIAFRPCGEMTFALADDQVGLSRLNAQPLPAASQVLVLFRVCLEEGLSWMEYAYLRHDPERPGQWVPTTSPYFPPNGLPGPALKRPTRAQSSFSCSGSSTEGGESSP